MVLLLATVAAGETHVGDWDVTGEITASGNFATFGDSSYVTPFSGWSGSSRMVAVRQPNAVSSGVSAGFMFSNNQTSGAFKNIAQLMFLNEAIVAADKRVAQIVVTTGGNKESGKMFFRVYDSGSATDALVINRFGGTKVRYQDGYEQTAAFMGATGGGGNNTASGSDATVGGGRDNDASGGLSTVGGGRYNTASGNRSTVLGGYNNTADDWHATVGGGELNTASAYDATVGGGYSNLVTDNYGTIAGGFSNQAGDAAGTTSDAAHAMVGGGAQNTASGQYATVGGGFWNTATGYRSTVPGGYNNTSSGEYSFAAGRDASATHDNSFVWGDDGGGGSAAANTFNIHASNGVYLNGALHAASDRAKKENFEPVDSRAVLAKVAELPMSTWNYKTEDGKYRHMGPMGQDFRTAFGLGSDDKHITTVDADGVALAAIQGLYETVNQVVQEKDAQIEALQKKLETVEARLDSLIQN
jgi:hypothetical protein